MSSESVKKRSSRRKALRPRVRHIKLSTDTQAKREQNGTHHPEPEQRIEDQLSVIYEDEGGEIPDMSHFDHGKGRGGLRAFFTLLLTCAVLFGVILLGFFALEPKRPFSEEDIIISISGDERIGIGEQVRYRIRYRNDQQTDLRDVTLSVKYPEGFIVEDVTVQPIDRGTSDQWDLGVLSADDSGFIDILGTMYGSIGDRQSFRVFLTYTPDNFRSEFQKVATVNTEIVETPYEITVKGPDRIVPGREVTYRVQVRNLDDVNIDNTELIIMNGSSFSVKSSMPEPIRLDDQRWMLEFGDDAIADFTVTGVFSQEGDLPLASLSFAVVGWKGENRTGKQYVYGKTDHQSELRGNVVVSRLIINGADKQADVTPGEKMNITAVIKNESTFYLQNVVARLILDAPYAEADKSIIDWEQIVDPNNGIVIGEQLSDTRRRGSITWSADKINALKAIAPDEELTIDLTLSLHDKEEVDLLNYVESQIQAVLEISYTQKEEKEIMSSQPLILSILSDTMFRAIDTVSGSGDSQVHTIRWQVDNTFHDLADVILSADLYGDVTVIRDEIKTTHGTLHVDDDSGKLTWEIGDLPAVAKTATVDIPIQIHTSNPTQTNLTSKVRLEARDTVLDTTILKIGDAVLLNQGNDVFIE